MYQYPWLLDFRGHCGSDNRNFIYRIWMKFGKRLHSIVISMGLMYFLCVVSEIAKILGFVWGSCMSVGYNTLEITQTFLINATMYFQDVPAYNSFSSIAEKQKGLEQLIKFSCKKCGLFLISHLSIPFFCSYFTCSILAFLAHMLPSCRRWVTSLKCKLSLFQPFRLKYCGYLSPVRCFFFFSSFYII